MKLSSTRTQMATEADDSEQDRASFSHSGVQRARDFTGPERHGIGRQKMCRTDAKVELLA